MIGLRNIIGVTSRAVLGSLCMFCVCGGAIFGEDKLTEAPTPKAIEKYPDDSIASLVDSYEDDSESSPIERDTNDSKPVSAAVSSNNSTSASTLYKADYPGKGLVAEVEYLNWRTSNANQTFSRAVDPTWLTTRGERATSPSGSGLRARLGYRFANGWDVSGAYVYFNGDDSATVESSSCPDARLASPFSCLNLALDDVTAESSKKLNMYDLEVGRQTQLSTLDFRPFGGLRIANLKSNVNETYHYSASEKTVRTNTVAHTSETLGYGVRIGGEARVKLWGGLAGFGRGAGSVLIGDVDSTSLEIDESQGTVLKRSVSKTKAAPMLEAAAGLEWRYDAFAVKGGYELNSWFNASELNAQTSDELFHGFFAGASWNF